MKRTSSFVVVVVGVAAIGCGGGDAASPPPNAGGPPKEPVTAEVLRSRWEPLAAEESEVARAIDEMGGLPPDARMQRMQRARDGAGFIMGGLSAFAPPDDLAACHKTGLEGARELKEALDGIHALWIGKGSSDRRAESTRLAQLLCIGTGKLAAARSACGMTARVQSPLACASTPAAKP